MAKKKLARIEPLVLLYTIAEAAKALKIGRTTLYYLISTKQLRPVKVGERTLFTAAELQRFVKQLPRLKIAPRSDRRSSRIKR